MKRNRRIVLVVAALVLLMALVACGGGAEPIVEENPPQQAAVEATPESAEPVEPTQEPEPVAPAATPEPEPTAEPESGAVGSFQDVQPAIIQIEAQGSFVDPAEGLQLNTAGRGSGFIIDPEGIAVTNNHVVTGAAFLQVWVGGEDNPRNAKILGVSECSDLAVIDIADGGYSYLEWYEGAPTVGTEIYVAGFPLGDPEYTLTRGIVSKQEAFGETPWSSVDHVLEYDANTNPGNSGGAVVDSNGKVVAVHYAGRGDTRQAFGIGHDVAQEVVERLRQGQDWHSIGVNGQAVVLDDGSTGIWVSSVKSGSPADQAGLEGGDIITRMEGLVLGTDGTMADYCDILRSRDPGDVMSIEVLRFATQEVLEGQLNGRPLEQSFSFAQQVEEPTGDSGATGGSGGDATYMEYVAVSDDAGSVVMEVPVEWAEVDGSAWEVDGTITGAQLSAATSLQGLYDTYDTPGVILLASAGLAETGMGELLDLFDFSADCGYEGRSDYEDPIFVGQYDLYTDCQGSGNAIIVLAAQPEDGSYKVVIVGQAVTSADLDALDHVLDTFNVVGAFPGS